MGLKIENRGNAGGFSLKNITNNGNFSVVILPSPSISITPSITPSITFTPTITPSATPSNTITPSISTTPTVTFTPSISTTPTVTFTPSISTTPSITPSITIAQVTQTPTLTVTPSISRTPSITPSISRTPSITPSISRTITPTPSITPSAQVGGLVSSNLFMELDASDYTSGTWNDRTANNNDATINGATWLSTDGGIFDFDGLNDTISIPHNSSLSLTTAGQKTIQVWVKFDALPASNTQGQPVFGKLSSGFNFDGYWGGLFSDTGNTRVVTNGAGVQKITTSTSNPVAINTWYLYTFISQITGTSNTTKVYINETEVSSTAHGTDSINESNTLYLGFIGTGVSSPYLNGKIGACYFYTKGLSASEVSQNYNATKTRYGL